MKVRSIYYYIKCSSIDNRELVYKISIIYWNEEAIADIRKHE